MGRSISVLRPVAFGLGGALLIWAGSLLIPDRYTSSAILRLNVEPYPEADTINQAYQGAISRKSLKSTIEHLNLYPGEREKLPLEDVIDQARQDFELEILKNHDIRIAFGYPDSGGAQSAANAMMANMIRVSEDYFRKDPGWGRLETTKAAGPGEASSVLAFWRTRRYVSHGTMTVTNRSNIVSDQNAVQRTEDLRQSAISPARLADLIARRQLYPSRDEDPKGVMDDVRRDLRIKRTSYTLFIKFTYPDAALAQSTVGLLITELIDEHNGGCVQSPAETRGLTWTPTSLGTDLGLVPDDMTLGLLPGSTERHASIDVPPPDPNSTVTLLDTASLPVESDGPSRPILSIFGFFLGLGLWTALKE